MPSRNGKYYSKTVKTAPQQSSTLFNFGVTRETSDETSVSTAESSKTVTSAPGPCATANVNNETVSVTDPTTAPDPSPEPPTPVLDHDDPSESTPMSVSDHADDPTPETITEPPTPVVVSVCDNASPEESDSEIVLPVTVTNEPTPMCDPCIVIKDAPAATISKFKVNRSHNDMRRHNSSKYESQYLWLYHSEKRHGYICKYCEMFDTGKPGSELAFTQVGAVLGEHPTRRLTSHESSKRHQYAVQRYAELNAGQLKNCLLKQQAPAGKQVAINRVHVVKVMKMVRFLIQKKWGFTDNIKDLAKLVSNLGDESMTKFLKEDINYLSSTSVTDIMECMSLFYKQRTITDMADKPFSLLLDESTDNANRSQASIMARWIGNDGNVKEEFVELLHMEGCKAVHFQEAVIKFCNDFELQPLNIRFVALDGCNTMSGEKTGLQRRIRHLSPHSLYVNCRNHKLALCFVHMMKNRELLQDVEGLLLAIWKMFHYSAKRHAVFHDMQQIYGDRPLTFVKASGTRWLSHLRASVRFVERYQVLLDTFDALIQDTRDPEIEGIRAKASNSQVVFTILMLTDILKPVNFLSLYLQQDSGYFTSLGERVKACIQDLHDIIQRYQSGQLQDLEFRKADGLKTMIEDRTDMARHLRAHAMVDPHDYLETTGVPIVYDLIAEIEDAFFVKSPVLSAFSVLEPGYLPVSAADLPAYGQEKIQTLAQHYGSEKADTFQGHTTVAGSIIDKGLEQELTCFRTQLFMMKTNGVQAIDGVLEKFRTDQGLRMCFSKVQQIYQLAVLIPQSTAVVERSFSLMNDICTFLRTSLTPGHLSDVMRIASGHEPTDADYEAMVDVFKRRSKRFMKL